MELLLDRTSSGEVTGNIFVDTSQSYSITDESTNSSILGSNVILTRPETPLYGPGQLVQSQIWHRMFPSAEGETFQIQLTLSDAQMSVLDLSESDITLHGMVFHFKPAGAFLS